MNTEIIDYIKALSKRDFFLVDLTGFVCSLTIIICGIFSLRSGASVGLYTLMYACATLTLALNSYKSFRRKTKTGWIFAVAAFVFLVITGLCVYGLIGGV